MKNHGKPVCEALWGLQAGKLEKHVKTEDPPKKNNGPVKIVTGSTFEEFVTAKGQNTLIEFYAPWYVLSRGFCQHIQDLFCQHRPCLHHKNSAQLQAAYMWTLQSRHSCMQMHFDDASFLRISAILRRPSWHAVHVPFAVQDMAEHVIYMSKLVCEETVEMDT